MTNLTFLKRSKGYVEPLVILIIAAGASILAVLRMLMRTPSGITSVEKLKDAIFGQLWLIIGGPSIAKADEETPVPALVAKASGVVLELGPGVGSQLSRYDKSRITKVYGVEPCLHLHEALRGEIKSNGLADVYEIVPCGIQDVEELRKYGITSETIDTVLSVQVLCAVPNPDQVMRQLYAMMKPGGQFILYEHVRSSDTFSRIVQNFYNLVWPFFVGNCHLNRETLQSISQAGKWSKKELTLPTIEDAYSPLPRLHGRLWKT